MNEEYLISYKLKNIALFRFESDSYYSSIVSPFSRIYLITQGKGWLLLDGKRITLEPGYLFLVPSFHPCSYFFESLLEHYYIHFTAQLLNGLSIYNLYKTKVKAESDKLDRALFGRLLKLNPGLKLPVLDPDIYQTKEWLTPSSGCQSLADQIESRGIIEQFISRFVSDGHALSSSEMIRYNLNNILIYIQNHIHEPIGLDTLAKMACLSKDHFIRVFKKVLNIPPGAYVLTKRIEKAKLLLLTTDKPIKRIFEECGFKSESYFSRIFKKYTSYSPSNYRKKQTV